MKTLYQCDYIGIKCYRKKDNTWEQREYYRTKFEETNYSPWTECGTFRTMTAKQVLRILKEEKENDNIPYFENWEDAKRWYEAACPY